ncbi:hypothetical protein AJ80_01117 [Polytolypa hystricis UAMH7299]|uniref:Thiol-specific monooxygenase n=1 Tax=Polytolypa hystricis (strain UAMH7299) TaxID=1447883 RepID=A0A2B7Z178_POLH7|nr:hypothetical protein AJ80_01117 [Polytolypa hystricis UAMH7299]
MTESAHKVRTVAIIGAGPSGLAAAKYLLAEQCFEKIDIFEQRNRVGGVWNRSSAPDKAQVSVDVPQLNPHQQVEEPLWHPAGPSGLEDKQGQEATFVSPLYNGLETNIPKTLMQFSDKPFAKDEQLFPRFESVIKYLNEYGKEVRHLMQFHVQVLDVQRDESVGQWSLSRKHLVTGRLETSTYDAVVVASGHYTVPYIPDFPGISAWNNAYPGIISHSKSYLSPDPFQDKKVIVIGNSASGLDIGSQISKACRFPLLASSRSESYFSAQPPSDRKACPQIVEFLSPSTHNRAVRFQNGDIEDNIDAIVFCTGYLYSYPFLRSLKPPVIDDGSRTLHVYQQIFYIEHPTLAFPVLSQKVIPFPLAENQCAVLARVWSDRLELPSKEEMYAWEDSEIAARGFGKPFHVLPFPLDANYLDLLYDWAAKAPSKHGLANGGNGKQGIRWGEKERWIRDRFTLIRKTFASKGEDKHLYTSPEALGFDFELWKAEQGENINKN